MLLPGAPRLPMARAAVRPLMSGGAVPRRFIVDTDAGVDDAVALCMGMRLARQYGCVLPLVTTVFGNCAVEQVGANVVSCVRACGLDQSDRPRIVAGAPANLRGDPPFYATYFHGADGLGGAAEPMENSELAAELSAGRAADAIVEAAAAAAADGAALQCVAIGPLTNLALALRASPDVASQLDVVLMGGCASGRGNTRRTVEYNVFADPEAAAAVFAARWRSLTVLPWELCLG